ncbi:MAG: hypothetical protein AB7P76_03185 [Candidatus Melainabacteria bacterium]
MEILFGALQAGLSKLTPKVGLRTPVSFGKTSDKFEILNRGGAVQRGGPSKKVGVDEDVEDVPGL